MKTKTRSTRGFTLLEGLIAVLIVGIIATAALPLLGSYTEKAREAREEANMVVKAQAIDRYVADHKVGLGMVYDEDAGAVVDYGLSTLQGPAAQLLKPTDVNGNVIGDPVTAANGPYSYGPYLAQMPPAPASILLAAEGLGLQRANAVLAPEGAFVFLGVSGHLGDPSFGLYAQAAYLKDLDTYAKTGIYKQSPATQQTMNWVTVPVERFDSSSGNVTDDAAVKIVRALANAARQAKNLAGKSQRFNVSGDQALANLEAGIISAEQAQVLAQPHIDLADWEATSRNQEDVFAPLTRGGYPIVVAVQAEDTWDQAKAAINPPATDRKGAAFVKTLGDRDGWKALAMQMELAGLAQDPPAEPLSSVLSRDPRLESREVSYRRSLSKAFYDAEKRYIETLKWNSAALGITFEIKNRTDLQRAQGIVVALDDVYLSPGAKTARDNYYLKLSALGAGLMPVENVAGTGKRLYTGQWATDIFSANDVESWKAKLTIPTGIGAVQEEVDEAATTVTNDRAAKAAAAKSMGLMLNDEPFDFQTFADKANAKLRHSINAFDEEVYTYSLPLVISTKEIAMDHRMLLDHSSLASMRGAVGIIMGRTTNRMLYERVKKLVKVSRREP